MRFFHNIVSCPQRWCHLLLHYIIIILGLLHLPCMPHLELLVLFGFWEENFVLSFFFFVEDAPLESCLLNLLWLFLNIAIIKIIGWMYFVIYIMTKFRKSHCVKLFVEKWVSVGWLAWIRRSYETPSRKRDPTKHERMKKESNSLIIESFHLANDITTILILNVKLITI